MDSIAAAMAPLADRPWFFCVEAAIETFVDEGEVETLENFAAYVLEREGLNLEDTGVSYPAVMKEVFEALGAAGVPVAERTMDGHVFYFVAN